MEMINTKMTALADAVRLKAGISGTLSIDEMTDAVNTIEVGSGGDIVLQEKTVAPTTEAQTVTADSGYDGLESVTVEGMPSLRLQPVTPGVNDKTVGRGYYLPDGVTVKGDSNLTGSNIKYGATIFGVTGTAISQDTESFEHAIIQDQLTGQIYENPVVSYIRSYMFCGAKFPVTGSFPNCITVGKYAFSSCSIQNVYLPECTTIGDGAFQAAHTDGGIKTIYIPKCVTIGSSAFNQCYKLKSIDLPLCETIGNNAFMSCSTISHLYTPKVKTIGSYAFCRAGGAYDEGGYFFPMCEIVGPSAFQHCYASKISLPICYSLGVAAFSGCTWLNEIELPMASSIGIYLFLQCSKLTTAKMPACTQLSSYGCFQSCIALTSVSLPICSIIGSKTFENCTDLSTIDLPECITLGSNAFSTCTSLENVSIPKCTTIYGYAFYGCYTLKSLTTIATVLYNGVFSRASQFSAITLTSTSVCRLNNSNAFTSTSITSTTGSIFVPASLVEAYKSATNWTYFADRIFPIEEATE